MDMELNQQDIDTLTDAMDDWADKPIKAASSFGMTAAMLSGMAPNDECREAMEKETKDRERSAVEENKRRKRQAGLIKAKLIILQQRLDGDDADKVLEDARSV